MTNSEIRHESPASSDTCWELLLFGGQVWDEEGKGRNWKCVLKKKIKEMCSVVFLVNFTLFYRAALKTMHQ